MLRWVKPLTNPHTQPTRVPINDATNVYQGGSNKDIETIQGAVETRQKTSQQTVYHHLPKKPCVTITPRNYRFQEGREGRNEKQNQANHSRLLSTEQTQFSGIAGYQRHRPQSIRRGRSSGDKKSIRWMDPKNQRYHTSVKWQPNWQ